jgi:ABC-type uncharacterized transport system involved in gliding motility auxiliary subunit
MKLNKTLSMTLSSINLVLYLVVIALWLSIPDERWLCLSLTGFNFSLSFMLAFLHRDYLLVFIKSAWFQRVANSLISLSLVFFILSLLNYLSFKSPIQWDFNENKLNSLTTQSLQVIDSLEGQTEIILFANKEMTGPMRALVELYRFQNNNISIRTIDPELRPDLVAQYQILKPNVISIEYNGKKEIVETLNELSVTNALIRLSRESDPKICFSTGHNELDLKLEQENGMSQFAQLLIQNSYRIEAVMTSIVLEIPRSCDALAIINPRLSFQDEEVKMIKEFMDDGGGVLVTIGPDFNDDRFANLRSMVFDKGIKINNDLVIDMASHVTGSNGSIPLVSNFESTHAIVKGFQGSVFFPLTSSLEPAFPNRQIKSLIETSKAPYSWAERSVDAIVQGTYSPENSRNLLGPVTLMMSYEPENVKAGRMVALGNGTLLMNSYANFARNGVLLMNALSWLVREDRLIAFDIAGIKDEPIFINAHQMGLIFYSSVILIPLLLLFMAFHIFRRRANL